MAYVSDINLNMLQDLTGAVGLNVRPRRNCTMQGHRLQSNTAMVTHLSDLQSSLQYFTVKATWHLLLLLGGQHEFGPDMFVKLLRGQRLQFHCRLLQSQTLLVSVLGHFGSHVIADDWVQTGNKHETGK